jgi:lipopolysaccharide export system permease protein
VFKKLDKLVLKAFIGPFIATFFITILVLVMQFFWLYIDDFVGKGISPSVIAEFVWYKSTALVPLALPLAVLLSSLMTFGNLGETYELVAIKSSGISLLRFMRPLLIVTIFICGIAFLFANYLIPVGELKSRALLTDIVYAKPSFDLQEGVFYDKISGFAIKVGKKEKDTVIKDIIIYEQRPDLQDNFIVASDGIMRASDDKKFLEFILKNGTRYEERGNRATANTEYIRLGFKEYKKQFDISSLGLRDRTADSVYRNNAKVLSMRQLNIAMDSLRRTNNIAARVKADVFNNSNFSYDTIWKNFPASKVAIKEKNFDQVIPDSIESLINQRVSNRINSMQINNQALVGLNKEQQKIYRQHQNEWHRKISLSLACLVLFLIGAPLGSIIRKGGLGMPLILAIVFFMLFFFSSTMGEKAAKEGSITPFTGMWLSTFILLPIGLFLTYQALQDSQFFSKEFYFRTIRRVKAFFRRSKA